jgi:hypothetical protein
MRVPNQHISEQEDSISSDLVDLSTLECAMHRCVPDVIRCPLYGSLEFNATCFLVGDLRIIGMSTKKSPQHVLEGNIWFAFAGLCGAWVVFARKRAGIFVAIW